MALTAPKNGANLTIENPDRAEHYLSHLNYYRLGAYWLPFEADHETHQFRPDASFDQVLNLYIFDRELRLLVMDAIERIEVSVRTRWAYHLAHTHGPHAYLDPALFKETCESALWDAFQALKDDVYQSMERKEYYEALGLMARLRKPVDEFFDGAEILVKDDQALRENRVGLLQQIAGLFLSVGDLSRFSI